MNDFRVPRFFLVGAVLLQVSCATPIHPRFIENFAADVASDDRQASSVLYNHALNLLAVGTWGGIVEIWDTRRPNRKITVQGGDRIDRLYFSDDGKLLFTNAVHEHN